MQSFNESEGSVEYKSNLERLAFRYCDANPQIVKWSCEPFHIPYIKPTDNKIHRYYIDLYVEFKTGDKFLVEIKSSGETKPPVKPKKITKKSENNYKKSLQTWLINSAKWESAKNFCSQKGLKFIILTENELN